TSVTYELPELLDALHRLERWLPQLEQRQCWALPFYSLVRPILQLVVAPPAADGPVSLSIVVIDDPRESEKTAVTLTSMVSQTRQAQEIFVIAAGDTRVEQKNSTDTLS